MYSKTVKYTDYDGNEREETYYFNFKKSEIVEMETSVPGGLEKKLRRISSSQDGVEIMATVKEIISKAYGEKSDDGRRFIKSEELSKSFMETEGYSEFFMELMSDPKNLEIFINSIIPQDLAEAAAKQAKDSNIQNMRDFVETK